MFLPRMIYSAVSNMLCEFYLKSKIKLLGWYTPRLPVWKLMESVSAKLQKGVKLHDYESRYVSNVEILNANVIINSVQVN